jgi:DNA-binding NtrC family response regulator
MQSRHDAGEPHARLELFADRFVCDGATVVDLATAEEVSLWRAAITDQIAAAWDARAETWFRLRHPALAGLVDFDAKGPRPFLCLAGRLSRVPGPPGRSPSLETAARFLQAHGLERASVPLSSHERLKDVLAVPADMLENLERAAGSEPFDLKVCQGRRRSRCRVHRSIGILVQPRVVQGLLLELLEPVAGHGVRAITIGAEEGAGFRTLWHWLAREARHRGYVPVAASLLKARPGLCDLIADRHVVIVETSGDATRSGPWNAAIVGSLLRLGLTSPRPHLVLRRVTRTAAAVDLRLGPLPAEALTRMIWMRHRSPVSDRRVVAMAHRANGNPGTFLALLGERPVVPIRSLGSHAAVEVGRSPLTVRETAPAYEPDPVAQNLPRVGPRVATPPSTSQRPSTHHDVRLYESQTVLGLRRVAEGRLAAGERLVRHAIGALARRGWLEQAGRAGLPLGRALLDHGRAGEAEVVFAAAQAHFDRARGVAGSILAAIGIGEAALDAGRLARAEAALGAAAIAAKGAEDPSLAIDARLGLARCLFWQDRRPEAEGLLRASGDGSPLQESRRLRLLARLALAGSRLDRAGSHAVEAETLARASEDEAEMASALALVAAVHLAIASDELAGRYLAQALRAARRAHAPMRAVRARLMLLETCSRGSGTRLGRALAAGFVRRQWSKVPGLLRARAELALADLLPRAPQAPAWRASGQAFIRSSGARMLETLRRARPAMYLIDEVTDLLRICHEEDEEGRVLGRVCDLLRDRLGASGVAIVDANGAVIAYGGHPGVSRSLLAPRVVETGLPIRPPSGSDGVEAGVPIRAGRGAVAALLSRWPPGTASAPLGTDAYLTAAAAACAPLVRAWLDARAEAGVAGRLDGDLLGTSPAMDEVRRLTLRAGLAPFPVLVEGESGSGKELVARAIHRTGPRRDRRLAVVNCAALTDELLEAELFGHTRGAFTGAVTERAGLFEEANGGTLFLDEVSELSARAQAKLLRVIQEGEIRRVGENLPRRTDVRVVAATNRPLRGEVEAGRFRADLFYRLDVIRIVVPPLRDRPEDIAVLTAHFWRIAAERLGSRASLDPALVEQLARYDWPGNVRELQNTMAVLAVHAPRKGRVRLSNLPDSIASALGAPADTLSAARQSFERRFVRAALARTGGHRGRAAAELGLSRQGLAKLLLRLQIEGGGSQNPPAT